MKRTRNPTLTAGIYSSSIRRSPEELPEVLFQTYEDIWWLCARCTALECNNLGSISKINFKKVSVEVKKIKTYTK